MKRYIIIAFLAALVSCEKDVKTELPSDQPLHQVTFDLSGFTRQTIDMSGSQKHMIATKGQATEVATSTEYAIYGIHYFVYKGETLMHKKGYYRYSSYMDNFGVIKDSLPVGDYYIEIVGTGRGGPYKFFDAENRGTAYIGPDWDKIPGVTNPEVYHKFLELKVREDTYLDTVELERVTGTIAVRLTDAAIPDSLRIRASATSLNGFYFAFFSDEHEYVYDEFIRDEDIFGDPYDRRKFDLIVFPYKEYGSDTLMSTVTISATGPSGKTFASKIIEGVEVKPNWKVILKGALLKGGNAPASQEFRVVADSVYTEIKRIEF